MVRNYERSQRVAEEIQRIIAEAIRSDIKDFDLSRVTVTRCETTRDFAVATIWYSVLGDEEQCRAAAHALERLRAFFQRRVGEYLRLRQTPHLRFSYDDSIVHGAHMQELFEQIARERKPDDQN